MAYLLTQISNYKLIKHTHIHTRTHAHARTHARTGTHAHTSTDMHAQDLRFINLSSHCSGPWGIHYSQNNSITYKQNRSRLYILRTFISTQLIESKQIKNVIRENKTHKDIELQDNETSAVHGKTHPV